MKVAVAFPGQGSQAPMMGEAWRGHPAYYLVKRASDALGRDLEPFLISADHPPATTRDVQLCVFVTSMMAWEAVRPVLGTPAIFAGHSFGQITALTAAGVLDFEEGVRLVACRGDVTDDACRDAPGGMIAVLGLDNDKAAWACSAAPGQCWLANDNAPGQVVLAGAEAGLLRVSERARRLGARKIIRLAVDGAFHTPLMLTAAERFAQHLSSVPFGVAAQPIMSNADARLVTSASPWPALLADHLISPVRWRTAQLRLAELGVDGLVEVGFGTTLTSLARRTVPAMRRWNVDAPGAVHALADELRLLRDSGGATADGPAPAPESALAGSSA